MQGLVFLLTSPICIWVVKVQLDKKAAGQAVEGGNGLGLKAWLVCVFFGG